MEANIYERYRLAEYTISVLVGGNGIDTADDNVDVEVQFTDGSRYVATFFTLKNIQRLLDRYKVTGECANGTYIFARSMIVVEALTESVFISTVRDLVATGELVHAFQLVESEHLN